jgi:hypothetical protein
MGNFFDCLLILEVKYLKHMFGILMMILLEGCGGFVYKFSFDEVTTDEDFVYKTAGD